MKTIRFELGNGATLALPDDAAAQHLVERQRNKPQPAAAARPRIGEYFPGQGGIYAGDILGNDGTIYGLIIAPEPETWLKAARWGADDEHNLSEWDGLENTELLHDKSPAAKLASNYEADGHHDFYLPSRREMMVALANLPQLFKRDWYWTSTTRCAHDTWAVSFETGAVRYYVRDTVLRVRSFRRVAL